MPPPPDWQNERLSPDVRPLDHWNRPLRDLRLSVTDRCNLRCKYCMPEDDYAWLPRTDILTFEEISRLVDIFVALGVEKVRITGGEPLLRRDLPDLVARIAAKPAVRDLALTTNGVLLAGHVAALRDAGLRRVTISLDTLHPERFVALTGRSGHDDVLAGIRATTDAGLANTKLDTVIMRGVNDDELADLVEFAATENAEVRFIEYMDVGGATNWDPTWVVSRAEMLQTLTARYGTIEPVEPGDHQGSAPASRFALPDGRIFGIVSSTTQPFCASCDRSRITADGMWYRCLYARTGTDLRSPLRGGAGDEELSELLVASWRERRDQGAIDRLALRDHRIAVPVTLLRRDPHLEMHTRGG